MKDRISGLELDNITQASTITALERQNNQLLDEASVLEETDRNLARAREKLETLTDHLKHRKAQLKDLRVCYQTTAQKYETLIIQDKQHNQDMIAVMEKQLKINNENKKLQIQNETLRRELDSEREANRGLKQIQAGTLAEVRSLRQRLREASDTIENITQQNQRFSKALLAKEQEIAELTEQIETIRAAKDRDSSQNLVLQSQLSELQRRNRQLTADKEECENDVEQLRSELAANAKFSSGSQSPFSPSALDRIRASEVRLRGEIAELENANRVLKTENNMLRSQLSRLESTIEEQESPPNGDEDDEAEELRKENAELLLIIKDAEQQLSKSIERNSTLTVQVSEQSELEHVIEELSEQNESLREEIERGSSVIDEVSIEMTDGSPSKQQAAQTALVEESAEAEEENKRLKAELKELQREHEELLALSREAPITDEEEEEVNPPSTRSKGFNIVAPSDAPKRVKKEETSENEETPSDGTSSEAGAPPDEEEDSAETSEHLV
jgi:chromosome segregation ATPase